MTHSTIETLDWLIEYWPDLLEARLPMATKRPWQQPELSPEARDRRDFEARIEWSMRNALAPGETPAPLDINILQVVLDVLVQADDLQAKLAEEAGHIPLDPPGPGQLDARPYLAHARARLTELDEAWQDWAGERAHRMYEQVARCLAMLYTGQTVRVICPWCGGRTAEQPVGGAWTWRVAELPGGQIAIICTGTCEPPPREVGTWWGGQPCWPITEWSRLAKHVRAAEAA